ncbi:hypothetical protein ACE1CD_11850 [Aerosakkonema sp. BLCC-F183]|uniref:hypothetical protein n=1 Tax=Aerosakkonema sp. BLCC-F183 TaxID=3342834 RepID=UPI0035B95FFF
MALELAAVKIAEIAFGKLVETAVGKGIEAGVEKLKPLRDKIWHKLRGNPNAEAVLAEVEKKPNPSPADLQQIAGFLESAMVNDPQFAQEVQTLAQEIHQQINVGNVEGKYVQNVYGGQAHLSNDSYDASDNKAPVFQGGNHQININYNPPPDH